MKRSVVLFFSVIIILLSLSTFGAYAYDPSSDGIGFDVYSGVYYPRVKQGNAVYCMKRPIDKEIATFEAWVYLSNADDRAGVIFSNKTDGSGSFVSIETDENGAVVYKNSGFTAVFDKMPLPIGEWAHTAIVIQREKDTVTCFVNGKEAGVKYGLIKTDGSELLNPFTVGGDSEYQNYPPFRGRIREICLFSYAKDKVSILGDMRQSTKMSDPGVIAAYTLDADKYGEDIEDKSGGGNTLVFSKTWLSTTDAVSLSDGGERSYSFAVIGDTQYMSEFYPSALCDMYGWIADNKERHNIEFVIGLGDMTNRDTEPEWQNVKNGISALGDIPFSVVRGNHDIKDYTAAANDAYHLSQSGKTDGIGKSTGGLGFDRLFATDSGYTSRLGGVFEDGSVVNSWQTLEVADSKWLILSLDYMPSDAVLEWASSVVSQHSDCRVIVTTHAYLDRNGKRLEKSEYIWDSFVSKHKNIVLVLSGHINSARTVTTFQDGVAQMLVDMQSCDNRFRGAGFVTLLHFNRDGTKCEVECISTSSQSKGLYYRGINCFSLDLAVSG